MMINEVTTDGFTTGPSPQKFEAGTPPITQLIGLAASIQWLETIDWQAYHSYETSMLSHAKKVLETLTGTNVTPTHNPVGCISFYHETLHAHDIADILSTQNISVRAGHHCTQPLLKRFGVPATARASFSFYNDFDDVKRLIEAVEKMKQFFS